MPLYLYLLVCFPSSHYIVVSCRSAQGGSNLGTRRTTVEEVGVHRVAQAFVKHSFHAVVLVGGFEAYLSGLQMFEARDVFPQFRIPIVVIPATISNNVPGTDITLGSDTSLNEITLVPL